MDYIAVCCCMSQADVTDITSVTSAVIPEDNMTDQSVTCDSRPVTDSDTAADVPVHVRQSDPALDTMTQTASHAGHC